MGLTGGCHCGAVRYEAAGQPLHHALCHCSDCRRWSGAPVSGWIAFAEDGLMVTGETATYRSSEHATREFCDLCGTGLFYRNAAMLPGLVDVHSGTLDDAPGNAASVQIMTRDRLAWMDRVNELPAFDGYPPTG